MKIWAKIGIGGATALLAVFGVRAWKNKNETELEGEIPEDTLPTPSVEPTVEPSVEPTVQPSVDHMTDIELEELLKDKRPVDGTLNGGGNGDWTFGR